MNLTREQALQVILDTAEELNLLDANKLRPKIEKETITEQTNVSGIFDSLDALDLAMTLEKNTVQPITESSVASWITFENIVDTYLIVTNHE